MSELIQSSPVTPLIDEFPQPPSIEPLLKAAEHCRELLQNNPEDIELRIALTNVYGRLGCATLAWANLPKRQQLSSAPCNCGNRHCLRWQPIRIFGIGWAQRATGGAAWPYDQEETAQGYQWLLSADEIWEQLAEEQPDNLDVLAKATWCRYDLQRITDIEFTRGSVPAVPRSAENAIGATIPGILQQPGSAAESGAPQAIGLDLPGAGQRP